MLIYLSRRLGFILFTILLASIIIFVITQLMPGDVASMILGRWATEQALDNLREELGLNRPAYVQYLDWLGHFVTGDWGTSQVTHQPAQPLVMQRLRNSAMLGALALLMYVPLGVFLGVVAALREDKPADQLISASSMTFVGIPEFVIGLILIAVFSLELEWLPANSSIDPGAGFFEALPQLILPAITVSLINLGYIIRMTRASTIDVLKADYVRAADLKGLPRSQVLIKHVLRNALLPTVTVVALGIGFLIGGLIITEQVFGYPGLGRLLVFSIQRHDLILIQACSMIIVAAFGVSNLVADLLYSVLNPRIRLA
jgi:peptide/nickel transport system permease protein